MNLISSLSVVANTFLSASIQNNISMERHSMLSFTFSKGKIRIQQIQRNRKCKSDNTENTTVSAANIRRPVCHVLDPVPSGEVALHMPTQRKRGLCTRGHMAHIFSSDAPLSHSGPGMCSPALNTFLISSGQELDAGHVKRHVWEPLDMTRHK